MPTPRERVTDDSRNTQPRPSAGMPIGPGVPRPRISWRFTLTGPARQVNRLRPEILIFLVDDRPEEVNECLTRRGSRWKSRLQLDLPPDLSVSISAFSRSMSSV
jgi:hypothetical protein